MNNLNPQAEEIVTKKIGWVQSQTEHHRTNL